MRENTKLVLVICISVLLSLGSCYLLVGSQVGPPGPPGITGIQGEPGESIVGPEGPSGANFSLDGTWELVCEDNRANIGAISFSFTITGDIAVLKYTYYIAGDVPGYFRMIITGQGMEYEEYVYGPTGKGIMYLFGAGSYSGQWDLMYDNTQVSVQVYQLSP